METEEKQVNLVYKALRILSKRGIVSVSVLLVISVLLTSLLNFLLQLAGEPKLIIKTVLFVLFFGTIPLMFYTVSQTVRKISRKNELKSKLRPYARLYKTKLIVYIVLSVLALTGFILTTDPMILILPLAGIFFMYYERPGLDKIAEDLAIEEENTESIE
jgi:hypothetical protein